MNDIHALYKLWREKAVLDNDLQEELNSIDSNEEEILDRFYKNLEFGTGGLRGVIGAGTNRMNVYTVAQATQGILGGSAPVDALAALNDARFSIADTCDTMLYVAYAPYTGE